MNDFDAIVQALGLVPHPEGGFFVETYRSAHSTAICYLLPAGSLAAPHVVRSDEVWHFYAGDPLELHTVDDRGTHSVTRIGGPDVAAGERPQVVIPAGVVQAARPLGRYALCGCTVAPTFQFADWRMPPRSELDARFPQLKWLWDQLSVKTVSS